MTLPDLSQPSFTREELIRFLSLTDPDEIESLRNAAERVLFQECGPGVAFRGLVEASNACRCDCLYCGIRKSNRPVERYTLDEETILALAHQSAAIGYGSFVIQTGERQDEAFLSLIERSLRRIKKETKSEALPQGLGITLSIGEQTEETYARLFEAGAHRYLLRIESSTPALFARLHPPEQRYETRVACLKALRRTGYQVGTGVMIGLPFQSEENLADDILFFKKMDVDMIGMGPFIPHEATPLAANPCPPPERRFLLGLLMIAATRLALRNVNIVAATALQALDPLGREKGLSFGANVLMPLLTPEGVRENYQLYPGKPFLTESAKTIQDALESRLKAQGRVPLHNLWADSPHAGVPPVASL